MADQVTNYQCPACTGPLKFDGESGKLVCEYCGSSYDVEEIEKLYAEKDQKAAEAKKEADAAGESQDSTEEGWTMSASEDWGENAGDLKTYNCPSCGAELICEESTAATQCPYCGNPSIVPGQFSGALKPDYVIPFKLEKKDALEALKKHYKGKFLLPKSFTSENHVQKIQGVYVPFWMFDGNAGGNAVYEAEKTSTHREGNYEIRETKHYTVKRSGNLDFQKIPADASKRMPDDIMDSVEPYDYKDLKPFSTAYLPGYLADKYDVSMEECSKRADKRAENSLYEELQGTVKGYDTVTKTNGKCKIKRGKAYYAMMPVWILNTKWNGKDFIFAMNGQTGRIVGDLPISWGKFWGTFAAVAGSLSIIFSLIASAIG